MTLLGTFVLHFPKKVIVFWENPSSSYSMYHWANAARWGTDGRGFDFPYVRPDPLRAIALAYLASALLSLCSF
jgi:hypothetical protein